MAYDGAVIRIPLETDVQGFVADIKKQIKGVKDLGLDVDTSSLENALDSYLDAFKKISNQKLNTSSFTKAQESVVKEIDALKQRTSALESGFASLIDVMKNAEGGKFANSLQDIKQNMQSLYDVTAQTVGAIQQIGNVNGGTSTLEKTLSVLKEVQNVKSYKASDDEIFGDFKTAKNNLIQLYNEIIKKRTELANMPVNTDDDRLKVAEMQKEVSELSEKWKGIFSANYDKFEDSFDAYILKIGNANRSFDNLSETVEKTLNSIRDNVDTNVSYIEKSLNVLSSINATSEDKSALGDIHVKVATTPKGLKTQLTNLLESVQPYLDENPLEVGVTIATEWGTRRNKELLKQFQQQIDNLSEDTDVSALRNLYEDIQKSFGNEINLKFKSNFDEEQNAIRAGVAALKAEIKNKFTLNPTISKTAADKMQTQLDAIAKNLVLSISQVRLTDDAIESAAQLEADQLSNSSIGAEALSGVINAIVAKSDELNKQLIPTWQTLVDIREVLKQYPIDSIVDSTRELVRVIQQAFGVLSQEDLDSMFSGLQKRANAIAGNLGLGKNQNELKKILGEYREYLSLGGKNTLADLGGNEKVQSWFKRNKDIILETKDAVEQLDKAEDTLGVDNSELSSIDSLSAKLDEVIKKVQEKTEEFKKEETVVSSTTADEIHELDGLLEKLTSIRNVLNNLFNTKKIKNFSSSFIGSLDNIIRKIDDIISNGGSLSSILSQMHGANTLQGGGTERLFYANSKSGIVGNSYVHGNYDNISNDLTKALLEEYTQFVNDFPDIILHTHPSNTGVMSLVNKNSRGDISGDLEGFYQQWEQSNHKVRTAVISGLEQSEIFNFGSFFEKYGEKYANGGRDEIISAAKEINLKIVATQQKAVIEELEKQGVEISKDISFADIAFDGHLDPALISELKTQANKYLITTGTTFDEAVVKEIKEKETTVTVAIKNVLQSIPSTEIDDFNIDYLIGILKNNPIGETFNDYLDQLGQKYLQVESIINEKKQELLKIYTSDAMNKLGYNDFDSYVSYVKTSDVDKALGMPDGSLTSVFDFAKANNYLDVLNEIYLKLLDISGASNDFKITAETSIDIDSIERIILSIGELQQSLKEIQLSLSNGTIFKGLSNLSPEDSENISKVTTSLSELSKVLPSENFGKGIDKVRTFVNAFSNEKGADRIHAAAENIKELRAALDGEVSSNSLLLIFQKLSESTDISGLVTEIKNLLKVEAAANQAAVAKKEFSDANKKMKDSADESSLSLEEEKKKFDKIWSKLQDLNQEKFMPGFVEKIKEIKTELAGIDDTADDAAQAYKNLSDKASQLWKERGFPEWKKAAETSIASLQAKIAKFGRDNTAIAKQFSDRLEEIRAQIHDGMSIEEVQKLGAAFKKLDADIATAGQGGLSFFDTLRKRLMGVNAQLIAQYLSWQDMIRYTRQAVEVVKDLDTALVDLKKTTTMSESELNGFYYSANDIAKQMGVTTEEIINQAASWSRLGYSSKEAAETMAALSSQFASISPGMDTATAQEGLVSIMKAYKVEVDDVERDIMDNINVLGNKFAETNEDIVEGMKRAGATLSVMGTSIEDSFALFTGAQEVIQNAETVGTALKTLSLRIRGYDEETEELSDDIIAATGKVADLTKVASNNFAGVSLWADAEQTQYRSLKDYLGDIARIWDEIDAKSQTELLENLFGKRGASVGSAILKNFSQVEQAIEEMENAAGAADAEMGIIEESLEYKINNLQQTWVGILQELIDNGMLGDLIDALTSISEVLGEIITTIGPVPTLLGGLGLRELLLNLDKIPGVLSAITNGFALFAGGAGTLTEVLATMSPTLATLISLLAPIAPYLIAIGAAAVALYGIYKIWDTLTISVDEANEALGEFNTKYNKTASEIKKHQKAVENLSDSYFELAKGVDSVTGKNINLSNEDYDKFVATNQELAEMFPELISGVDEYGNYILDLGDNAEEAKAKLASLIKQEQDNYNYELYKDLPEVSKNTDVLVKDANKQIKSGKEQLELYDKLLGKLNDISNLSSDANAPFILTGNIQDEDTTRVIDDFLYSYQNMLDHLAATEPDIASNLRNALADESVGDEIKKVFHLENLSQDEKLVISNFVKSYVAELSGSYKSAIADATSDIREGQTQLSSAWASMQKNIIGGINFLSEDEKTTQVLSDFVKSIPSEFASELEGVDLQAEIAKWVSRIDELSDEQKLKLNDLINADLSPSDKIKLYDELRASLPEGFALDVPIHFVVDEAQDLIDTVKASKSRLSKTVDQFGVESVNANTLNELNDFFDKMGIDTKEEYNEWLRITATIDDAHEAMKAYSDALDESKKKTKELADSAEGISFTQSINDLHDLESALNSVGTAIANIDENGNFQLGDLDTIADYFLGLESAEKKVEYETEAVANALKLLGEGSGTIEQQADAINTLADNYLHTSNILDGLNEKNKELYITRLNSMGIINAEEIVLATLNAQLDAEAQARAIVALQAEAEAQAKELIANETVNLTNLTAEEINALLEEGTITQETALKLLDMAIQKQMVNGNVLTTSGDIANLTALCTSLGVAGSALERYAEMKRIAMDDTGKYTPEYQAGTMKRANQMLQNAIKAAYNSGGAEYNIPKVQYNGGSPVKNKLGYTPSSTADAISGAATKAAKDAADAAKGAAEDAKEEFKETIDFFERMIKVLDQSISLLKAHLEDVVGSFAKNTLIDAQEAQIRKKMEGYSSAIEMYSAKASEALSKVPSDVAAKLQSGAVAIDEFVGEENKEVVEAAQEYEQWADKVADCKQQIVELREELRQLELQKFKNVAQDFQELFDVRQTQIDLISKAISLFESASDKIVGRGFYDVQIDQTAKQLDKLYEKRVALINQANSAMANGIDVASEEWFEMLNAIEDVNGAILDSQKNIEDYKNAIVQLYVDAFDRESNRYTKQIALRQKAISALEKQISVIQSAGNLAGTAFFEKQIEQNRKSLDMLQKERQELMRRMSDATANGVRVGTDEWYSMVDALNAVDSAIQDCEESINSLDDAILALHTATFERIQSRFESLASEMSNMTDMFEGMDVATVDNKWTKEGLAQLGLLAQQYELAKKQVAQYNTEIEELNKQYADAKYSSTEYVQRLAELKEEQWDAVKSAKAAKDSIMSLNEARVEIVVKGINEEIEAYQKLIDEQKKLLSTEKDLHDYEKSISKSTQAVQDVERQLAALADDNSLAAAAKRAKLEEELRNAREDLAEQEYAHSVEVQQEALDEQLENYRETRELEIETLQESLENEEQIIQESFDRVKENTALIGSEILTMAQSLNITMSEEITAPWQSGENAIASYSSLMNIESSNFIMRLNEVENSEWRLQEQANNSSVAIADMFANQSDNLVAQTEAANAQFRQEEADAQNASAAIANAFGQRADSLVQTIEDARNSTANLTNMSNALADSLSNSIDGSYSGASAASALESIADAARDVGNAASEAVGKVRELIEAQSEYSRKSDDSSHVTTVYGGPDAGKTASWKWDKNGQIQITSGVRNHYAQGTKGVSRSQLAWTQEDGPEAIINPSDGSILTPLQRGSAVLPADQTSNIWQWSRFDPETFAKQLALNVPKTGSNVQANTLQIGNLVNVSGNVNDTMEMMQIAATTASAKIKQSFNQLSNGLNK